MIEDEESMPQRLFEALKSKNSEEFNRVFDQLKRNYQNDLGWCLETMLDDETLFTCAVVNNRIEELKKLLEAAAQSQPNNAIAIFDKPNKKQLTPFLIAVNKYNIEAMKLFIQFGINPNTIKINEQSLIQYVAKKADNPIVLIFLISVGTQLTIKVEESESPLAIVQKYSYVAAEIYIIAGFELQKACVNIMSYQNLQVRQDYDLTHEKELSPSSMTKKTEYIHTIESALSACLKDAPKLIADFLENLNNQLVQYPFNEHGKQLIHQWLIKLVDPPEMLQKFIKLKMPKTTHLLPINDDISQMSPHAVNELGYTQLHIAIMRNDRQLLLDQIVAGANVNLPDKSGNKPVILAALNRNKEALILLIIAGADFNYQLPNGVNALTIAKQQNDIAMEKIIEAASLLVKWIGEVENYVLFVAPPVTASGHLIKPEEKEKRCLLIEGSFKLCVETSAQLTALYLQNLFNQLQNKSGKEVGLWLIYRCLGKFTQLPEFFDKVYLLAAKCLYDRHNPIGWLLLNKAIEFNITDAKELMQKNYAKLNELNAVEMALYKYYLLEVLYKPDWHYCIDITKKLTELLKNHNQFKNVDVKSKYYVLGVILLDLAASRTDKDAAIQDLEIAKNCFMHSGSFLQSTEMLKKVNLALQSPSGHNIIGKYNTKELEWLTITQQFSARGSVQETMIIQQQGDNPESNRQRRT